MSKEEREREEYLEYERQCDYEEEKAATLEDKEKREEERKSVLKSLIVPSNSPALYRS